MANKADRLVIDTNIFISFLITDSFSKLYKLLESKKVILLFSEELLQEFLEVTKRPKLRKYFSEREISKILDGIHHYADFVDVHTKVNICRDPNDNFLLALAVDGKADYLITGDEDLLVLKKHKHASIIKISDFFKK